MKKNLLLTILVLIPMWIFGQNSDYYYYYNGEKQYLELNTEYAFVSVKKAIPIMGAKSVAGALIGEMKVDNTPQVVKKSGVDNRFWAEVKIDNTSSRNAYSTKLQQLSQLDSEIIVAPYFKTSSGKKIGLSNYFYVKLYELADTTLLKKKAIETKTEVVGPNKFMPLWYVMSVTHQTKGNAMDMANLMYESGEFEYAEPDLMEDAELFCVNDPYFPQQWGLSAINVCNIWPASGPIFDPSKVEGRGIVVAVLDHGIQLDHPDLKDNIHPLSYDTETNSSPSKLYGAHGTQCAGIIGAVRNNNIGIAGVAPKCQLMSISNSLLANPLSRMTRADGISWAWRNGADVISNSWGSGEKYTVIDEAIKEAVTFGRSGLGTVVVFASGNDYYNYVSYPAELPEVIAVGSINSSSKRAGYSQYGENLSVVAPGVGIYTTTIGSGYSSNFGGTSAACPHVAGVAALMLSKFKNLSLRELRTYMETTAQKLPAYNYTINKEHGKWNNETGYGLVDAYAAVKQTPSDLGQLYGVRITPLADKEVCIGSYVTFRLFGNAPRLDMEASSNLFLIQSTQDIYQYLVTGPGKATIKVKTQGPYYVDEKGNYHLGEIYWVESDPVWVISANNININGFQSSIFTGGRTYTFTANDPDDLCEDYEWTISGNATIESYGNDTKGRKSGVTILTGSSGNFQLNLTGIHRCGNFTKSGQGIILPGVTRSAEEPQATTVRVYSINGNLVLTSTDEFFDIKNTDLKEGVYIIETIGKDGEASREKVVLKR